MIASSFAVRTVPTSVSPAGIVTGSVGGAASRKRRCVVAATGGAIWIPSRFEQRHVQLLRHAVEPVDDRLGQPGEQLDERDPGVGDVVLGPLRAALAMPQARLVDEVLEAAVVERDFGDAAHYSGSSGIT